MSGWCDDISSTSSDDDENLAYVNGLSNEWNVAADSFFSPDRPVSPRRDLSPAVDTWPKEESIGATQRRKYITVRRPECDAGTRATDSDLDDWEEDSWDSFQSERTARNISGQNIFHELPEWCPEDDSRKTEWKRGLSRMERRLIRVQRRALEATAKILATNPDYIKPVLEDGEESVFAIHKKWMDGIDARERDDIIYRILCRRAARDNATRADELFTNREAPWETQVLQAEHFRRGEKAWQAQVASENFSTKVEQKTETTSPNPNEDEDDGDLNNMAMLNINLEQEEEVVVSTPQSVPTLSLIPPVSPAMLLSPRNGDKAAAPPAPATSVGQKLQSALNSSKTKTSIGTKVAAVVTKPLFPSTTRRTAADKPDADRRPTAVNAAKNLKEADCRKTGPTKPH